MGWINKKNDHAERIFTDFAKRGSAPDMAILGISRSGYPDNDAIRGLVEDVPFQQPSERSFRRSL